MERFKDFKIVKVEKFYITPKNTAPMYEKILMEEVENCLDLEEVELACLRLENKLNVLLNEEEFKKW